MYGRNIDKNKVKVKVGMKHFFACGFEKFYIVIWSCMKLEDVFKVLPMLILDTFVDHLFLFGDMRNVQRFLIKFFLGLMII